MYLQIAAQTGAWLLAGAWMWQAVVAARGLKQIPSLLDDAFPARPSEGNSVVVVVPACNEETSIGGCVTSLLEQDWEPLHVLAVNDRSTDSTGAILEELARKNPERLTVLHVEALPAGWLGKTHAMAMAARHAMDHQSPRWLLFTDGDVMFHRECLRRSLAAAGALEADHFVTAPTAIVHTAGEAAMMSFLQVVGLWGAKLWRVADPKARDAVGIGAFNLLRSSAYLEMGGFERLRLQILEDLALARLVKDSGLRQRIAFAPQYVRIHWAPGVQGVLHTMTKNLFAIFGYQVHLVILACAALTVLFLGPTVGLFWAPTRIPAVVALAAVGSLYATSSRWLTPFNPATLLGFPVAGVLFLYAILRSTLVTLSQGGVRWRGTFYPLAELRERAEKLR